MKKFFIFLSSLILAGALKASQDDNVSDDASVWSASSRGSNSAQMVSMGGLPPHSVVPMRTRDGQRPSYVIPAQASRPQREEELERQQIIQQALSQRNVVRRWMDEQEVDITHVSNRARSSQSQEELPGQFHSELAAAAAQSHDTAVQHNSNNSSDYFVGMLRRETSHVGQQQNRNNQRDDMQQHNRSNSSGHSIGMLCRDDSHVGQQQEHDNHDVGMQQQGGNRSEVIDRVVSDSRNEQGYWERRHAPSGNVSETSDSQRGSAGIEELAQRAGTQQDQLRQQSRRSSVYQQDIHEVGMAPAANSLQDEDESVGCFDCFKNCLSWMCCSCCD